MLYCYSSWKSRRAIAEQLVDHWKTGYGRQYNPHRAKALEKICIKKAVGDVMSEFQGSTPMLIGTSSTKRDVSIGYGQLRRWIKADPRPFLLLFGTGWGLPPDIVGSCERDIVADQGTGGL